MLLVDSKGKSSLSRGGLFGQKEEAQWLDKVQG